MRFLIDAKLPRSAVEMISSPGHDVEIAPAIGLGSATDEATAARARDRRSSGDARS
jgi:predicted nuclease of predicted toxin-antitoxin system